MAEHPVRAMKRGLPNLSCLSVRKQNSESNDIPIRNERDAVTIRAKADDTSGGIIGAMGQINPGLFDIREKKKRDFTASVEIDTRRSRSQAINRRTSKGLRDFRVDC